MLLAWGFERRLIAFLAGAFGALAMPPLDLFPALLVSLPVAIWLIDGTGGANRFSLSALFAAAGAGWWWGFGYLVAGLWWLGSAFLVEQEQFLWALPLGVVGLPAGLALFFAFGFALARLLWSGGPGRIFALAAGLGMSEWLRGHLFTGFPWNGFGQALGDYLVSAQAASVVGAEGLGLLALLLFSVPVLLVEEMAGRRTLGLCLAAVGVCVLIGFGAARLVASGGLSAATIEVVPGARLRLMQPNIAIAGYGAANGASLLETYIALSKGAPASGRITSGETDGALASGERAVPIHLIWPESPFPFVLARQPQALGAIAAALGPQAFLLTGAIRVEATTDEGAQPGSTPRYYNAIQAVDTDGTIVTSYDKVHLVPFGEYLPAPFKWLIGAVGLRQFVHVPGGFSAGAIRRPFAVEGLPPALPLLCYEAIFPSEVNATRGDERWLLNLTNDAWFGETFGPYQHFAQARLRAVEQGLPLVRAANTGISAVIDPYGRIVQSLPVGVAGTLDTPLPKAIARPVFVRYGQTILAAWLTLMAILAMISAYRNDSSVSA